MCEEPAAQLGVSGHQSEIGRHLEVVELELHPPESWNDVGCDLLAEVPNAQRATQQHAQKSTHEKNQYEHGHLPNVGLPASMHYAMSI
jgi:hypothetical protein